MPSRDQSVDSGLESHRPSKGRASQREGGGGGAVVGKDLCWHTAAVTGVDLMKGVLVCEKAYRITLTVKMRITT